MKKIIALIGCLWALCAGATNITNYPVRTTFNSNYWFLLSDVAAQTNWNLPGNYVASTTDLNSVSNTLWQLLTNSVATNITFNNLYVSNGYFDNITVTNGITNLSLTAKTVLEADANKAIASIPNGAGALTNNNLGDFGWYPGYASLEDVTNITQNITNQTLVVTNVWVFGKVVVVSNGYLNSLTVTNPITNLSLTANTIVQADANKALASVPNGTGALTNDGAGLFGWFNGFASIDQLNSTSNSILNQLTNTINSTSNALYTLSTNLTAVAAGTNVTVVTNGNLYTISVDFNSLSNSILTEFTNTINSTSNSILTQFTNTINSTSNSILSVVTNNFMTNGSTVFTNATVLVEQIDYLTNAATMAPNFAHGYEAITTNASFAFLLPINLDATKTRVQTTVVRVDNSTGPTPIKVTLPANVHDVPGSVFWITNSTYFTWSYYSPDQTNCYAVPIY